MTKTARALLAASLLMPAVLSAQITVSTPAGPQGPFAPNLDALNLLAQLGTAPPPLCEDGVTYDDGEMDRPVGDQDESFLTLAMAFDVPPGSKVEEVCVCWTRTDDVDTHEYELLFFADDGPDGSPGTQLGIAFPTIRDVPSAPGSLFHTVFVSPLDVVADSGRLYIAAEWFPGLGDEFFLCGDTDGGASQPLFQSNDEGDTWTDLRELEAEDPDIPDQLDALMMRARFSAPPGPCVEGPATLCLQDDRFRIEVDFATALGTTGQGQAKVLTDDTGYFWFFEEDNVEMVIKVLDACSFADRFWVFAGGLTNVEVEITVTDTLRGFTSVYQNDLNQPFQPIQDTVTFATCP